MAIAGVVAHDAVKYNRSTIFAALGGSDQPIGVDHIAGEGRDYGLFRNVRRAQSTTARHRGQQPDLIAIAKHMGGESVFGVDAHRDSAQDGGRSRLVVGQPHQKISDRGAVVQFERGAGGAQPVFQYAKRENVYLHQK